MQITLFSNLPLELQKTLTDYLPDKDKFSLGATCRSLNVMIWKIQVFTLTKDCFFTRIEPFVKDRRLFKVICEDLKRKTLTDVIYKVHALFVEESFLFSDLAAFIDANPFSGNIYYEICKDNDEGKSGTEIILKSGILSLIVDRELQKKVIESNSEDDIYHTVETDLRSNRSIEEILWKIKTILFIEQITKFENAVFIYKYVFEEKKGTWDLEFKAWECALDGDPIAQFIVGFCRYLKLNEVTIENNASTISHNDGEQETAILFLRLAAEKSYLAAYYYYGLAIKNLQPDLAFVAFQMAAELGYGKNGEAHYELACCYEYGEGIVRDHDLALQNYDIAKKKGHISAFWRLQELQDQMSLKKRSSESASPMPNGKKFKSS